MRRNLAEKEDSSCSNIRFACYIGGKKEKKFVKSTQRSTTVHFQVIKLFFKSNKNHQHKGNDSRLYCSRPRSSRSVTDRQRSKSPIEKEEISPIQIKQLGDTNFLLATNRSINEENVNSQNLRENKTEKEGTFSFQFDNVYQDDETKLYEDSARIYFRSALFGTSCAILTFGPSSQTRKEVLIGQGELAPGILQKGVKEMLASKNDSKTFSFEISCGLIYCDRIFDLLNSLSTKSNELTAFIIKDEHDLNKYIRRSEQEIVRIQSETGNHNFSDKSHIIFIQLFT